jgi:hypothetical protein
MLTITEPASWFVTNARATFAAPLHRRPKIPPRVTLSGEVTESFKSFARVALLERGTSTLDVWRKATSMLDEPRNAVGQANL